MSKILTTLTLASGLMGLSGRATAARTLAEHVGCQDVLIFVADLNLKKLLPAPGFPQTLPGPLNWQDFLAETVRTGLHQADVSYPDETKRVSCVGRSMDARAVITFIGGTPDPGIMDVLERLLPLFTAAFQAEQAVLNAQAMTIQAGDISKQFHEQAASMEQARLMEHDQLIERRRAEDALQLKATELERSNIELRHFAAIASHDLQEPLRMVTSFLGLLERRSATQLDEKSKTYIDQAASSAGRMSKLIHALLAYTQVGESNRPFIAVPLQGVLKEAIDNLSQRISETNAEVYIDELPTVEGDQVLLVQLFQNLIGNALKFSRSGITPVVRVTIQNNPTAFEIAVTDNGIGIVAANHELIFGVFQRLHSSDVFEGNGIGLATCRRIVERHHGRIWVDSEFGVGSTFRVSLKRIPTESAGAS